jgi:hypothetical protein
MRKIDEFVRSWTSMQNGAIEKFGNTLKIAENRTRCCHPLLLGTIISRERTIEHTQSTHSEVSGWYNQNFASISSREPWNGFQFVRIFENFKPGDPLGPRKSDTYPGRK